MIDEKAIREEIAEIRKALQIIEKRIDKIDKQVR